MRLVDWQIAQLQRNCPVIEPYEAALMTEDPVFGKVLPYGQAANGYVLRLAPTCAVVNYRVAADPKSPPQPSAIHGLNFVPQQSYVMALTIETVQVPSGFVGRLELLDEYQLCGLRLVVPEIPHHRPERVLMALVNPMAVPVWLYHNEGVAKLILEVAPLEARRAVAARGE